MKRFVSKNIDSCLLEASNYYNCSITQLEYEIIQNPSSGFLGLMKKEAIVIAVPKNNSNNALDSKKDKNESFANNIPREEQVIESFQASKVENKTEIIQERIVIQKEQVSFVENVGDDMEQSKLPWEDSTKYNTSIDSKRNDMEQSCKEIEKELKILLEYLPLDLNKVEVRPYDAYSISIFIDGLDAALLIGQKGYRYKSLSYLLFNWVNTCYGYGIRLEIAQFLKNQEDMIRTQLSPVIEMARQVGKAQTKTLDGILTHIALKILREELPNKYIVSKETTDGERYITINDFLSSKSTVGGFGDSPKY